MSEGLCSLIKQKAVGAEVKETYRAIRSAFGILACLLLRTNGDALTRPPRSLENKDRLSRTLTIAGFQSMTSGLVVGRRWSGLMSRILMKARSSGGVGMHRMRTPRGRATTPSASEIPHSRPGMRVTWKAAPPMKTMRTCPAISTKQSVCIKTR